MNTRPPNPQRGAVLALVLFMLAALSLVAVGLRKDVLLDHALSSGMRSALNAHLALDSGKRIAAAVLVRNNRRNDPDRLGEPVWGQFNDYLKLFSARTSHSDFSGTLTDENSRFPLPALIPATEQDKGKAEIFGKIFTRMVAALMQEHGFSAGLPAATQHAQRWLESILEWCGERTLSDEARNWYLARVPACLPPGRPLLGPEELLLVYWPGMNEAFVRQLVLGTANTPGLVDLVTVWGTGPLNVNTALPAVLTGLGDDPVRGRAFASAVERERAGASANAGAGAQLEENWYLDLARRHGLALEGLPAGVLDVRSRWYRLELSVSGGTRTCIAVGWVTNEFVTWEYQALR